VFFFLFFIFYFFMAIYNIEDLFDVQTISSKIEPKVIQHDDKINIIIIGSMGHGKSTFANYLLNIGEKEIFKTSLSKESCTKSVESNCFQYRTQKQLNEKIQIDNYNINVYDTPGLNELDDSNEIANIKNILVKLYDLEFIHHIVICMKYDTRNDQQFFNTLNYYGKLFKSVFQNYNFSILCTKMDYETYDELKEKDCLDQIKQENINLCTQILHCKIPYLDFINSKLSIKKKKKKY